MENPVPQRPFTSLTLLRSGPTFIPPAELLTKLQNDVAQAAATDSHTCAPLKKKVSVHGRFQSARREAPRQS